MSEQPKLEVSFSGYEAETHRVFWPGSDGIGLSVQGSHLALAIHHDGETHAIWLSGPLLEHFSDKLGAALIKVAQAEAAQAETVQ